MRLKALAFKKYDKAATLALVLDAMPQVNTCTTTTNTTTLSIILHFINHASFSIFYTITTLRLMKTI